MTTLLICLIPKNFCLKRCEILREYGRADFSFHKLKELAVSYDITTKTIKKYLKAKELMKIRPDVPVILCTGFSEMIDEEKAKAMGIRKFLMKPIVMSEIANTIREVLGDNDIDD